MGVAELRRLRQLEEENYRQKRLVADFSLDKEILQDVIRKSSEAGAETRGGRMPAGGAPHRGSQRIREIAETRIRYGVLRIHILLRREGWLVNHKKTHRIYCLERLNLRSKRPRRHVTARHRRIRPAVTAVDQCWSMDFVADNLFNVCRSRTLTIVDNFSRRCVAIEVSQGLRGDDVVAVMERIRQTEQRVPQRLQTDNGSEFISKMLDRWRMKSG